MPACFQLVSKTTNEPVKLQEVDDLLREELGFEPDEDKWLGDWYNTLGLSFAVGLTAYDIRENWRGTSVWSKDRFLLDRILVIIERDYSVNHWRSNIKE